MFFVYKMHHLTESREHILRGQSFSLGNYKAEEWRQLTAKLHILHPGFSIEMILCTHKAFPYFCLRP